MASVTHKDFWRLALPFTLSTLTQPLLGVVDTAVVGRLGDPSFIGGVAVGTVIFNTLYWLFGFLRVATSGFAAQSLGSNRPDQMVHSWLRPLTIAFVTGLVFILCQRLILKGAMMTYGAEPLVAHHAASYFNILIWGAPLVLIGYVNLGWLMGRGHAKEIMVMQMGTNVLNILLDMVFVLWLDAGVKGVATATLISQGLGFLLGGYLISRRLPAAVIRQHLTGVFDRGAMKKLAVMNRDLFIRTACLLTMTNVFVAKGTGMGKEILAANAILFQIHYLMAYLFDGISNAASVLAGKATGLKDAEGFLRLKHIVNLNAAFLCLGMVACLVLFRSPLIHLFTDLVPVRALCREYFFYLILFVPAMAPGLVFNGFFVGATCSGPVRNALVLALAAFLPAQALWVSAFGNHGLWSAFILFCAMRSLVMTLSWKRLIGHVFGEFTIRQVE